MRCASCQATYSDLLEACPQCRRSAAAADTKAHDERPVTPRRASQVSVAANYSVRRTTTNMTSTLIEFPGAARPQQPAWRKQLSERVREIQERRAREAGQEALLPLSRSHAAAASAHESSAAAQQLGLVPPPPAEEIHVNPIVAAALRRVARARQPQTPPPQHSSAPVSASPAPAAPVPTATVLSPTPSLVTAPKPTTNESRSPEPQTAVEPQPAATARTQAAVSDAAPSTNGATIKSAPPQTDAPPRKAVTHGVDVNSPAYLKYKQEEEARNRAKLLGAKQLAAKQFNPPTARAMATAAGASRATSAALAPQIIEPESVENFNLAADDAVPTQTRVVSTRTTMRDATPNSARRVTTEILDETTLARREAEEAAAEAARLRKSPDDYAPFTARIAGGAVDVIAVTFLCSPVAAAIELGYGDWSNIRIVLAMTLCVATITFLYIAAATAFAGRTLGMSLFNLRMVDVESGMTPTVEQGVRRGAAYVFSLLIFGLGFLYALIDPEGRGAHDHLSGTVVITE